MSAAGRPSESCAVAASALEKPTITSPGLALMPSTTGQTLTVPLICTLPVRGGSRHWILIDSAVVIFGVTANIADPEQVSAPSLAVAGDGDAVALPAGMPPTVNEIVWLWLTSTLPERANPPGPPIA